MSGILSSWGGSTAQPVEMVGYPESGGVTDFSTNQRLGTVQKPGSGFLGGFTGTGGALGGQGYAGGSGQVIGSLLRSLMGNSQLGQLGLYGLGQGLGTNPGGPNSYGLDAQLAQQFPELARAIRQLGGGGTNTSPSSHSLNVGKIVTSLVGG